MLRPFTSATAGTSMPSRNSACSGETNRSRFGTPSASAPAAMRMGSTRRLPAMNAPP